MRQPSFSSAGGLRLVDRFGRLDRINVLRHLRDQVDRLGVMRAV
jgi:hypothetical protein